jgi:nitrous oxidase accessory protein NosD
LDETRDIVVSGNRCRRGGSGGNLSAGIALLGVRHSTVRDNWIARAYGAAILMVELTRSSGNQVDTNHFERNGIGQNLPSVVWQYSASGRLQP